MNNKYTYNTIGGKVQGFFNIYQARNGKVYLQLSNCFTLLTHKQISDLSIDVFSLINFDYDNYKKAYQ